ncbi:zinc finger protein 830 [Senna tora]|uniref:Zinc finger protein 830 n=1 Tax=Senna tora TaxID=362788 RepID=A0A834U0P4_9FABA|nr:zinc finger protein 830 [Senna tora]
MDAQAKKKAFFRAKLNAQKKEKRLESPLVRYNEFDQPVCRVCDIVLKSESNWDAHQVSRKHREAITNLKANAAGSAQQNHAKPVNGTKLSKSKSEYSSESHSKMANQSQESPKPPSSSSSVLPPDFFDNNDTGKPRLVKDSSQLVNSDSYEKGGLRGNNTAQPKGSQAATDIRRTSDETADTEIKQTKGVLPEGFFDNKEADLRARGIKPVKLDVKDEYKEFEKLIQEDLKEVDDRLEEDEIDAAEMIEEAESVEQKNYREKVEMLRRKRLEMKDARPAKRSKSSEVEMKESRHEEQESSSDDDSDENLAVDWRAQHL